MTRWDQGVGAETFLRQYESTMDSNTNSASFTIQLKQPLEFPSGVPYKVALIKAVLWNTVKNVSAAQNNNQFRYSHNGGSTWTTVTLMDGSYTQNDLNAVLRSAFAANGHSASSVVDGKTVWAIQIEPNRITSKMTTFVSKIIGTDIPGAFLVDWYRLSPVVGGVSGQIIGDPTGAVNTVYQHPNNPDFTNSVSTVSVHSSLISKNNGLPDANKLDVIGTFVPSGGNGERFSYEPYMENWISIDSSRSLSQLYFSLRDQNNREYITGNPVILVLKFAVDADEVNTRLLRALASQ